VAVVRPKVVVVMPARTPLNAVDVIDRTLVISRVSITADRKRRRSHLINTFSLE